MELQENEKKFHFWQVAGIICAIILQCVIEIFPFKKGLCLRQVSFSHISVYIDFIS